MNGFIYYFKDLCDHAYSTEIFAKSINDKSMEGCTVCEYYDLYIRGKCECEDTPVLGEFVDEKLIDGYVNFTSKYAY